MNTISSEHRIIHPTVSKFGKTIDKSFEHELSGLLVPGFFQGYRRINKFDRAVHLYLLRHGYTISLDNFCLEANFSSEDDQVCVYLLSNHKHMYFYMIAFIRVLGYDLYVH